MDDMKSKKVNMIYITHYLDEVFRICDRASVFRDGENSGTFEIHSTDPKTLIKAMLGKELSDDRKKKLFLKLQSLSLRK